MTTRPGLGAGLTLASALLFGLSTPAAKVLLGDAPPVLLAGLLYAGAGIGLLVIDVVARAAGATTSPRLAGAQWVWLAASVAIGGIIGPVLLLWGLQRTAASTASLLLNLESVLTALVAWLVFRESATPRIIAGVAVMVAGAALVSWQGAPSPGDFLGPLGVIGACVAWGFDNNITRRIAGADPVQISLIRGIVAGAFNLTLAAAMGAGLPPPAPLTGALVVGFLGFGLSLVLFVLGLRHLGVARTAAFFATGPFVGALASVLFLGEPVTMALVLAGMLMAIGAWLTLAGTAPTSM